MSTLSAFIYKQRMRWYGRRIERCHELRRRLAFYVVKHGFEIGDYSMGQAEIRLYNPSRLVVGKYCSVAAGATFVLGGNHPTDAVTTSYLDRQGFGPAGYPYTRGDIVVGSDVWIASNAIVLSGVTIGDGAVVGAGSIVIEDVAPYTIVFGSPAKVVRKRFPDEIIAALLEVCWWDLGREQIEAIRPLLLGRDLGKFIDEVRKIRGLPPLAKASPAAVAAHGSVPVAAHPAVVVTAPAASFSDEEVLALIRNECPELTRDDLGKSFEDLGIDSFGMLTLRTKLEEASGKTIDDGSWSAAITPADAVRVFSDIMPTRQQADTSAAVSERRDYHVNLPQMAAGGLSESWLFKEIGDLHWSQISKGLGIPSSQVRDAAGDRLLATFTRVQVDSTVPLTAYAENEPISIEGKISRYGPAMFFNDASVSGEGKLTRVRVMSSFSKFGEAATNASLQPAQPPIAADCAIPSLPSLPEFAEEYRGRRSAVLAASLFDCEYSIVPGYDINGAGLLYFAAYPMINDICAVRYAGRSYADFSTLRRDVFYFANCDADDTVIYRIHSWHATDAGIELEESLARKSDGAVMSYSLTTKSLAGRKRLAA
jgi:probable biosynthetic protein (TIGR04098 family)